MRRRRPLRDRSPRCRSGRTRCTSRWTVSSRIAGTGIASAPETLTARSAARGRCRHAAATVDRLRFAFASCQNFEQGFYTAYRHMAAEELADRLSPRRLHLRRVRRDSTSPPARRARADDAAGLPQPLRAVQVRPRPAGGARCVSVDRHLGRSRGRRTTTPAPSRKRDDSGRAVPGAPGRRLPGLLRAHAAATRTRCRTARTPGCIATSPAATWRRSSCSTRASTAPINRAATTRRGPATACSIRSATMLGAAQERWLFDGLHRSQREVERAAAAGDDRQGQPPSERTAIATRWTSGPATKSSACGCSAFLGSRRPANPVVLTGDLHSNWVNDLSTDDRQRAADDRRDRVRRHVDLLGRRRLRFSGRRRDRCCRTTRS